MRFGPNSGARKVWYCKRKTQKCHLRFCGTVNKKGYSFRKGVPLSGQTRTCLWYFCGQTRKRRSFHCGVFYECHVLIKKMCTLESSKGRRRRPSRKKPVATRVVVRAHASEQVVGARLFAEKEKQSKLCSNVVGVSLKDL